MIGRWVRWRTLDSYKLERGNGYDNLKRERDRRAMGMGILGKTMNNKRKWVWGS